MKTSAPGLQNTLQRARKSKRLSQLELALRLGVSQRHISFVESGRASPSRTLLLRWLEELNLPLIARNEVMLQTGFAPLYSTAPLNDPALALANQALENLLDAHDPMPALIIDAEWNLQRMNKGARWLATTLMPWAAHLLDIGSVNMLDIMAHPEGFTRHMRNLHEVGPIFLTHLRHDAAAHPAIAPRVDAFAALLASKLGPKNIYSRTDHPVSPVLVTYYDSPYGELAFFNMLTTFGTPQDITLASLRVEHMFAADSITKNVLVEQVTT